MGRVSLAVAGAGDRGAAYALEHPDRACIVAVAEPRELHRNRMAELFSIPPERVFTSWEKMAEFETEYKARLNELQEGDLVTLEGGDFSLTNMQLPNINFPKFYLVKAILTDMGELIEELPELLLRTGVSWLLDVILIPLGLLFLLYKLAFLFTESIFGSVRAERFDRTLKKHLAQLKHS